MTNNTILRQFRYIFDFNDQDMIKLFRLADKEVSEEQIENWLKKEGQKDFVEISDKDLATCLNGFIILKRGKQDGPQRAAEDRINNNIIFKKLKIALQFKDTDIIDVFDLAGLNVSKHEITAIFRNPSQNQYRKCKDQFLRNFLYGLQIKFRPN